MRGRKEHLDGAPGRGQTSWGLTGHIQTSDFILWHEMLPRVLSHTILWALRTDALAVALRQWM
jgi:hypothetical protein